MTSACTRARLVTANILRPSAPVVGDQILSSDKGVLKSFLLITKKSKLRPTQIPYYETGVYIKQFNIQQIHKYIIRRYN